MPPAPKTIICFSQGSSRGRTEQRERDEFFIWGHAKLWGQTWEAFVFPAPCSRNCPARELGHRHRAARSGHPQTRSPPPTRAALALAGHKCTERAGLSLPSSGGRPHGVPMPALLHFVPSPRLQHWRMFEERSPVTPNAQALTTPPSHQASWGTGGAQPPGRGQKPHRVLQKG